MTVEVKLQEIIKRLDEITRILLMSDSDKKHYYVGSKRSTKSHPLSNTKNADYPAYDPSEEELLPKLKTLAFELGGQGRTGKGSCIGNLPPEVSKSINKELEKLLTKRRSQLDKNRPLSREQFKKNRECMLADLKKKANDPAAQMPEREQARVQLYKEQQRDGCMGRNNPEAEHRLKIAQWGAQQNQGGGYRKKTRKRQTRKFSRKRRTRRKK